MAAPSTDISSERVPKTEIIDFQRPIERNKHLYITNISVALEEDEASSYVQVELCKAFSKFGLVHCVLPFISHVHGSKLGGTSTSFPEKSCVARESSVPTNHERSCRLYAIVKFYSKLCANRAKEELHLTKIVGTTACRIQYSQPKKAQENATLYPNECVNVANFYLGFDGWSTSIRLMKRDDPEMTDESSHHHATCHFLCVVELVIPRHGLTTHGIGKAEEKFGTDMTRKGDALRKCRKIAHREALRHAFSKVLLVVVNSNSDGVGKVYAEVNTTIPDPFITAECLQDPTMLTVNELLEEPREESSDEENVDEMMIQLLADLESENCQDTLEKIS